MAKGFKSGGRIKGTPNKRNESFQDHLRTYCKRKGVDPHYFMVDMLADPETELMLQFQAAKELAQYLEPKLRAMEVSGNIDHSHTLTITDRTREANDRLARVRRADLIALPLRG